MGGEDSGESGAAGALGIAGTANKTATPITLDSNLFVDRASNALGIQGTLTTTVGTDTTMTVVSDAGKLCFTGSNPVTPQLTDTTWDYANYGGGVATLELCRSSATDDPPNVAYAAGSCPFSPDLARTLAGVRFTVDAGGTLPRQLRIVFKERGRSGGDSFSFTVPATGPATVLLGDAYLQNPADTSGPALDVYNLEAIQIWAFPSRRDPVDYSFCLSNLEILTGAGWSALPDWVSEPGPGQKVEYAGVNLAGADFGQQNLPGTYGTDYIYPSSSDIDIYVDYHMNIIRLPFRWERLQRTLGGEFDADELARLQATVDYAVSQGMTVILSPHNFGRYVQDGVDGIIGQEVDIALFADFWARMAALYAGNDMVFYGLMNEPHDMVSNDSWLSAANAAIAAIRGAGADNLILVPGNSWTGAHSWISSGNSATMVGVVDPGNNFVFELHQYLDSDSSGTHAACVSETIGVQRVQQVTEWLRTNGYRGILGEFNGGANETCYLALEGLMNYIGTNADVWKGWAVWAGGPWWGENILTVQPKSEGKDRPQMSVLKRHLPAE